MRGVLTDGPDRAAGLTPYPAVLSARYRMMLQYRAAALAGAVTQFFWGFIRIMILAAFYASSDAAPPMDFAIVVTYIWLGQAFYATLPWNTEPEIDRMVREGGVAYELLRPLDLYGFWYMRTLAMRMAATSLRALPIILFAGLILPYTSLSEWALAPPASTVAFGLFAVSLVEAFALSVAITMLVHVSLLWTISGDGMARVVPALVIVFSGMVIPLPLFPDWAQPLLNALPFRGLADVPYRIYTGHMVGTEVAWALTGSAVWTLAIVGAGRALIARGLRRMVVQGG